MSTLNDSPLRARLSEIEAQTAKLNREKDEILGALRVFDRYAVPHAADEPEEPKKKKKLRIKKGKPRPDGIPTIWDMTMLVFRESGATVMHIDDIVGKISKRWWPGVIKSQVAPTIYGFAKEDDGRLERRGTGEFALVATDNSGAAAPEEAKTGSAEDTPGFHFPEPSPPRA